jgi:hypothetical protein
MRDVITRIRVKWQGQNAADGVKFTIRKRDESGATTAWTTVGAQQSPSTSASVTVTTYDVADETMDANTSYIIEVESEVTSTGVNLYSAGIETNKRAL